MRGGVSTRGSACALEELDGAFVFFGCGERFEGAEIAAFAGFGILLARVKPIACFRFANHKHITKKLCHKSDCQTSLRSMNRKGRKESSPSPQPSPPGEGEPNPVSLLFQV